MKIVKHEVERVLLDVERIETAATRAATHCASNERWAEVAHAVFKVLCRDTKLGYKEFKRLYSAANVYAFAVCETGGGREGLRNAEEKLFGELNSPRWD